MNTPNLVRLAGSRIVLASLMTEAPVAKPNYQFEKRQRELEKKKKKEAKANKKSTSADGPDASDQVPPAEPQQ
jgi:hypothetical protein